MARTFALTIAYEGTRYAGWQIQPNGLAVQHVLSEAVSVVVGHPIQVQGSGRTDAGVHAIGQIGTFVSDSWEPAADRLVQAINRQLPRDIVITECREVVAGFDPIRMAIAKRYRYTLRLSRVPDPMHHPFHWWITRPLNVDAMREGATRLLGTHDFKAFESLGSRRKTSVRTVRCLEIETRPAFAGTELYVEIEADGFLYNMVRNIAGALVDIGRERFSPNWMDTVIASRQRNTESQTAPGRGLCLLRVEYPPHLFLTGDGSGGGDRYPSSQLEEG
jgi:tRNA pseudouridine38-40 synthase